MSERFADQLTIDTPEQISLDFAIAGPGSRFLAVVMDMVLQGVAFGLFALVFALTGASARVLAPLTTNWATAVLIFSFFFLQWGYFVAFEILWKGQTPGKRLVGIRVLNESGREVQTYEAIVRNLLRPIDTLPAGYALGALVMFLSPQNKRLGDYVAGTVVVHDRKPSEAAIFFNTKEADATPDLAYQSLTMAEINMIETFLQRRLDLDLEVRKRTAFKLAERFGAQCGVPQTERRDDENFLEMVVHTFRKHSRFSRT